MAFRFIKADFPFVIFHIFHFTFAINRHAATNRSDQLIP